eukprot:m.2473 g.2473  ORF g.2473 m.2473 type:complete len:521 (+) comp1802_c0_seq1:39-1601(+)
MREKVNDGGGGDGDSGGRGSLATSSFVPMPIFFASLIVFVAIVISVLATPYSKVEESFNLHAIHDIIHIGFENTSTYDHHEFPGVVPRTFLGSLLVGLPTKAISNAFQIIFPDNINTNGRYFKLNTMLLGRILLGAMNSVAFGFLLNAIKRKFSLNVMWYTALISATQFHFIFYASRTLPNTFAMPFVILAYAFWIEKKMFQLVLMFAFAVPIFRAELVALAGPILLFELVIGTLKLKDMLRWGLPAGFLAIGISVIVDSSLWGYTLWPEGTVLYFNTILNKSSQWGTEPFFWYFFSALPRSLSVGIVFVPVGVIVYKPVRKYVVLVLAFVLLYSFLPHKELRFVLYSVPLLNLSAACAIQRMIISKKKWLSLFGILCFLGIIVGTLATTSVSTFVSSLNYPGGEAMKWLHDHCEPYCGDAIKPHSVHICNLAAQSGASRFSQTNPYFEYSKLEAWTNTTTHESFSWLIAEEKDQDTFNNTHEAIHNIFSVSGITLSKEFPFLSIRKAITLVIMKKRSLS